MAIIELKLFISIILPLLAILFLVKGESRTIMIFLLLGLVAELLSDFLGLYIYQYVSDALFFSANISPSIEEILKGLPILFLVFKLKPEKQVIFEASIAIGIGFAILENAFIISVDAYSTSLGIAFLRGIGAGMMHAVCTLAVGYGMSLIYKKRWFFIPGTFLFLFMAMVYHSIFNTLVQSQYQVIGLCLPVATFIPLIIHIIRKNPRDVSDKGMLKFLKDRKMTKRTKNVVKIVIVLPIVALLTVSLTRCDGTRLTGGKNGIYGLSGSGMDIDQMVKAAMLTRQNEYNRMYKKEVRQEWLKEAYADLYAEIDKFENVSMSKYKMSSTFAPMQVTSSNSNVVTAVATADALETSHAVNVKALAANAALRSRGSISRTAEASICLKDIITDVGDDGLSFEIADNDAEAECVTFTKDEILDQNLTLNDLASRINKLGLNIKASYDAENDSFSVDNKNTGKSSYIGLRPYDKDGNYSASGAELLNCLNLCSAGKNADGLEILCEVMCFTPSDAVLEARGTDAVVIVDGKTYTAAENKLTVSDVTYSPVGVGGAETPISVTVKMDTEKSIENVRAFVEDYNKMIDRLNELYKEEKYPDYDVLTKEEEEEMTDEQIEKWNKKAKSGLLKGNQTIRKMIGELREAMYTPVTSVDGKYNTLMSIGISSADNTGHLKLDEDKLTTALQEDSDCAYQLFSSPGDDSLSGTKLYNSTGVAYRIFDSTSDILKEMKSYAGTTAGEDGSYLGTLILNMKNKMDNFQSMMAEYEEKMYKKYDAMETALSRLNSQFVALGLTSGDEPDNGQNDPMDEESGDIEEEADNSGDEIEEIEFEEVEPEEVESEVAESEEVESGEAESEEMD